MNNGEKITHARALQDKKRCDIVLSLSWQTIQAVMMCILIF